MESFWTDTPFGITILASLTLTMIASLCIATRNIVRVRAGGEAINDDAWIRLAAYLLGYAVIMLFVTYAAILVYYISGGVLDLIENRYSLSFNHLVWMAVQIWSVGIWLGTAMLIFRRVFHRWL